MINLKASSKDGAFCMVGSAVFDPAISEQSERRSPVRTGLSVQMLASKNEDRALPSRARQA